MEVSIVIPAYNSEAWLERAFDSVILQQGITFEVIIVDNNSADGTFPLMEKLRAQHPGLVRLATEPHQGSAAARNHGVRMAKGEWIQFLDADDVLLPGKLSRQLALVSEKTDWVIGASIRRDRNGTESTSALNDDPWKGLVHNGGIGHTNSNLIRKSALLAVGGQNEDLPNGVDTDLYFRLLRAGVSVAFDHTAGAVYLDREGYRLSEIGGSTSRQRMVRLIAEVISFLQKKQPDYYAKNSAYFQAALLNAIRILATLNLPEAIICAKTYFPAGIKMSALDESILPAFVKLYPFLGFGTVEGLRKRLTDALPIGLKRQLKGR